MSGPAYAVPAPPRKTIRRIIYWARMPRPVAWPPVAFPAVRAAVERERVERFEREREAGKISRCRRVLQAFGAEARKSFLAECKARARRARDRDRRIAEFISVTSDRGQPSTPERAARIAEWIAIVADRSSWVWENEPEAIASRRGAR